jgi:DNA polymerase III alpha subunit (gram-positive type)
MTQQYIGLDLETSSLSPETGCILEIAALPLDEKLFRRKVDPFNVLVRPPASAHIDPAAIRVNGHIWALDAGSDLYREALAPGEALEAFTAYLIQHYGPRPAWIVPAGWNVGFDVGFMKRLYTHDPSPENLKARGWPFHYHTFDLMTICRYLDVAAGRTRKSYALDKVARELFSDELTKGMHTATKDCEMMLRVFRTLEKR